MVTCPNCGNVCDDKANFCIKCGYNLKSAKSVNMHSDHTAPNSTAGHNQPFVPNEIPSKKRKKKSAAIIAISLIAVFVLVGVIAFNIFTRTRKTIDLEKCVDVSFTGYNGVGSAIMTVNSSRLKEQIEALKGADDTKFLFKAPEQNQGGQFTGFQPGLANGKPNGQIDPSAMSYDELCAYLEQNPDAKLG